ncbi:unnamed protein product [Ceratitis capitata]|uniref:(Mediterranean fruit fly) hypothetical protein n=1 Tax=Ceratitis capitata TaxID=7213 RepID=A0A811UQ33_CERCA|nr:unnamed protein product [Ceratitis capitata]
MPVLGSTCLLLAVLPGRLVSCGRWGVKSKSKLRGEAGKSSSVIRRREFRLKIIGNTVQKQVTTDTGWGSDERGEIPFEFDYEKLGANDGVDGATKQREGALYE